MRFDMGLLMGILFEYIIMVYYASTTFYPRKNYLQSAIVSFAGYALLLVATMVGQPVLSISAFFVVNLLLFYFCYDTGIKTAAVNSLLLDFLSIVGEYVFLSVLINTYSVTSPHDMLPHQSMALTFLGKMIYFTEILIMKQIVKRIAKGSSKDGEDSVMIMTLIPVATIICLTLMLYEKIRQIPFVIICILLLMINIVAFAVNEYVRMKNKELKLSREESAKNKLALQEFHLISEQQEAMRIMNHDFNKQMGVLAELSSVDKDKAFEYLKSLRAEQKKLTYVKYTDNTILNILLSQKIKECGDDIKIQIQSLYSEFDFLAEADTVAIFANLLDNAMEACRRSKDPCIYVTLYKANTNFPSVKIENSADAEPQISGGALMTNKENKKMHGVGMKSVYRSLGKYGGTLSWSYNEQYRRFCVVVVFDPQKSERIRKQEVLGNVT